MKVSKVLIGIMILTVICSAGLNVRAQGMPHVVFGTVIDAEGTAVANAQVRITNLRTDKYLTDTTNPEGQYQIDLSSLPEGYQIGDEIIISAEKGDLSGSLNILVSDGPNDQCDITIEEAGDTPFPGSLGVLALIAAVSVAIGIFRKNR